jgi:hypothetical protein
VALREGVSRMIIYMNLDGMTKHMLGIVERKVIEEKQRAENSPEQNFDVTTWRKFLEMLECSIVSDPEEIILEYEGKRVGELGFSYGEPCVEFDDDVSILKRSEYDSLIEYKEAVDKIYKIIEELD